MKNLLITIGIIIVLIISILFFRNELLTHICEDSLNQIQKFNIENSVSEILVANIKGDGSESKPNQLSPEISPSYKHIISSVKYFTGPDSRIYIYYKKTDRQNSLITIESSKMWKNSLYYFGDVKIIFDTSKH